MRSIWNGGLNIGMINLNVGLYSKIGSNNYSFNLLCPVCKKPINYVKKCLNCKGEFGDGELLRGIKVGDDYINFNKEELTEIMHKIDDKTIKILKVIDSKEITDIYLEKPYSLLPTKVKSGKNKFYRNIDLKIYSLLINLLATNNYNLLGSYISRGKEHRILIKSNGKYLTLYYLRNAEDVRETEIEFEGMDISKEELVKGKQLLDKIKSKLEIENDLECDKSLEKFILARAEGKVEIEKEVKKEIKKEDDLGSLLEASLV